MFMFDVVKSSKEFKLKNFKYVPYMTQEDEYACCIKQFDNIDSAIKYMKDNNMCCDIIKYESNGLVYVEEYYIAENEYDMVNGDLEFITGSILSNIAPLRKE